MEFNLNDKVAIITGGSKGIGENIAINLANYGCKIAICSRSQKNINVFLKKYELKKTKCYSQKVDVRNENEIKDLIKNTLKKFGKIDILINNVGGDGGISNKSILKVNTTHWENIFQLNVVSALNFTKMVLPNMMKNKWGRVIFISSISSKKYSGYPWYVVAKKSVITLMKTFSINREFVRKRITFNSISPGAILTEDSIWGKRKRRNLKSYNKILKNKFPTGKIGEPQDISNLILYLCSNYSQFINGSDISMDGGQGNENYED